MKLLSDKAENAKEILDRLANTFCIVKDGELSDFKFEFLDVCFKELLGSKFFAEQNAERRKTFFDNYQSIEIILNMVNEYVEKYPKNEVGEYMRLQDIFPNLGNDFQREENFKAN